MAGPWARSGKIAILSFHPRKAITTGEGGAIVTNDDELAEKCSDVAEPRSEIQQHRRDFIVPGLNYRMTEIQAAIGRVQLEKFPSILKKRQELADCTSMGLRIATALRCHHGILSTVGKRTWSC